MEVQAINPSTQEAEACLSLGGFKEPRIQSIQDRVKPALVGVAALYPKYLVLLAQSPVISF